MAFSTLANRNNFIRWYKIGGTYVESDLPTKKLPLPYETDPNNDVDNSTQVGPFQFLVTGVDFGISWANGGLKFYAVGNGNDTIYEFTATTAFDMSTLSQTNTLVTTADNNSPFSIAISNDGSKFFTIDFGTDEVQEWSMSTNYDISTGTFVDSLSITADIYAVEFNNDGTRMYVLQDSGSGNDVLQYTLTTGYDLSTASLSHTFSVTTQTSSPRDLAVSPSGNRFYVLDTNDDVFQYNMSSTFDLSTASYSGFSFDLNTIASTFNSITMTSDNKYWALRGFPPTNYDLYEISTSTGASILAPPTPYGNENQFEGIPDNYVVTLFEGETFSFYANLDTLETNGNFNSWRLDFVDADTFITQYYGVGTLQDDIISGYSYRFYLDNYTVPSTIENGCYRMVIIDTTDNSVLYISNVFKVSDTIAPYSSRIQYRNAINILNFNYETISFTNEMRIDIKKRAPNYPVNRIGYQLISGSFNPVRSVQGTTYEFVTENYRELDHEAWNSATIQLLRIYNDDLAKFEPFRRSGESSYEVEWTQNYPAADGSIRLEQVNTFSSNKNV